MTSFVSRLVSAAKLIRFNHSRSDRSFIACRCRTRLAGVFCLSLVLGYQPSTGCVLNSVWFISSAQIIRALLRSEERRVGKDFELVRGNGRGQLGRAPERVV